MLTIPRLKEFTVETKASIDSINSAHVVVTINGLNKIMRDHKKGDNILMIAIVPEHEPRGNDDSYLWANITGFYFLEKTDYSDVNSEAYLDIFIRTQKVVKEFINKITTDKEGGKYCGLFSMLDINTIQVSPVEALSSCNGYFVALELKTND